MSSAIPTGEPRNLSLDEIQIEADFNPRSGRDGASFEALVASVRRDGVLQPVLVRRSAGDGFVLIAGEGRYRAALEAGLSEIPALVRSDGELSERLVLAISENLIREDLDPVEEARGFRALIEAGLTKKGVAQRLGVAQKLVTERLAILELAEAVQEQVAEGTVPTGAIRALVSLARVHAGLPELACSLVGVQPEQSWLEPLSWSDVIDDPILSVVGAFGEEEKVILADAYESSGRYPLERFTLSEQANDQLAQLCELARIEPDQLRVAFDRDAIEAASALGAAHPTKDGWRHLIVGQDVADQLASDFIARVLNGQREAAADAQAGSGGGGEATDQSDEQTQVQRRAEREAQAERRRAAHAHNTALGAAVLKSLARLRIDADLLKVLSAIDVGGDLAGIAMRGARYGFPDWFTETVQKSGKVRVEYLDRSGSGAKASEFIARAKTPAEIAGRLFCLIAMAHYADEEAVAHSSRSYCELRPSAALPYGSEVLAILERICEERLPKQLVKRVKDGGAGE